MFLDGDPLAAGDAFLSLDVLGGATALGDGLASILVGGPSQARLRDHRSNRIQTQLGLKMQFHFGAYLTPNSQL